MAEEKKDDGDRVCSTTVVEAHLPGGVWGRLSGTLSTKDIFFVVIMILIGLALWIQAGRIEATQEKIFLSQHRVTQDLIQKLIDATNATNKLISDGQHKGERQALIQTYVLTLDDREKKALKISMPDELRWGKLTQ